MCLIVHRDSLSMKAKLLLVWPFTESQHSQSLKAAILQKPYPKFNTLDVRNKTLSSIVIRNLQIPHCSLWAIFSVQCGLMEITVSFGTFRCQGLFIVVNLFSLINFCYNSLITSQPLLGSGVSLTKTQRRKPNTN